MSNGPAGGQGWGLHNLGLLESVTFSTTPPEAFGPEHGRVAGVVAVGLAFMLSVTPRGQRLSTLFTLQAGPMPVFAQRGHPLRCRGKPPESLMEGRHSHPSHTPAPGHPWGFLHLAASPGSQPVPSPKGSLRSPQPIQTNQKHRWPLGHFLGSSGAWPREASGGQRHPMAGMGFPSPRTWARLPGLSPQASPSCWVELEAPFSCFRPSVCTLGRAEQEDRRWGS